MYRGKKIPARWQFLPVLLATAILLVAAVGLVLSDHGVRQIGLSAVLKPAPLEPALQNAQAAEQVVQRAWLLAQQAGAYDFRTEIEQTTYPAPALTNVGRPAQVDSLYLEGATDTRAKEFQVAIWQGGSILHRDQAYEVRTEGAQTYGRPAGGEWQPIEDISAIFAPGRDALAYLQGIKQVREVTATTENYRQFRFALDGPAFAETMRRQLEDELRRAGKLPSGITLDTPSLYRDIIGEGEIWLSRAGLPEQFRVTLSFPQGSDGSRVRAVIHTDFANFDADQLAHTAAPLAAITRHSPPWLANQLGRLTLLDWPALGMQSTFLLALALGMLLVARVGRRRHVYALLNLTVLAAMLVTPLLQSTQVAAFHDEQAAVAATYDDAQKLRAQQRLAGAPAWDANRPPLETAEAAAAENDLSTPPQHVTNSTQTANHTAAAQPATPASTDADNDGVADAQEPARCVELADCDSDGLTDLQEFRLGTRLDSIDSDGDKLRDDLEVKGFALGTRRWYTNPSNVDTNGDGQPDTLECWQEGAALDLAASASNAPCDKDADGDGAPDLFEYDNDGDGVDDFTDLSPFHRSTTIYDDSNFFTFQSDGLTPNAPLFVDFQLAPTSPDQISYAQNVLDWPKNDTTGQVVRTAETTFASGKPAGAYPPSEANGDLRLVPLVEVKIPVAEASKLLPVTRALTVTRSGVGTQAVITATGSVSETRQQSWLHASVELRADNGSTALTFTSLTGADNTAARMDKARIVKSACPVDASASSLAERTATNQGDVWTLAGTTLTAFMNGQHVLVLEQENGGARRTACIPLGDVANGALPDGQLFDQTKLDAYAVTLRDEVDSSGGAAYVIAYLPANVVTGQTGGEKQAFGARMPYWPTTASVGAGQQIRLVWMVQLLGDDGAPQIVHVYKNESWRLAGLSARQDIAVRSAVIYQNPDDDDNAGQDIQSIHARLWSTINVLNTDFTRGGDARLPLDASLINTLEANGYAPAGSLGAEISTYETQDELARIPADVTPRVLARFLDAGAYKPGYDHALLIFAREEEYKAARWDGGDTLAMPAGSSTLAAFSWKPFRYAGSAWEPYPATAYLDLLQVRLRDAANGADILSQVESATEKETIRDGMAFAAQAFAMGMLYGVNRLVAVDNTPIPRAEEENETAAKWQNINEKIVGASIQLIAAEMTEDLATNVIDNAATVRVVENFEFASEEVLDAVRSAQAQRTNLKILGEVANGRIAKFRAAFGRTDLSTRVAAAGLSISVISIGLVAGNLLSTNSTLSSAFDVALPMLAVASQTMALVSGVNSAISAARGAGGLVQALKVAEPLSRATKIAAVVGLVLAAAVSVGIFVTQWVSGAFNIADLGFTAALSGVIATLIVAVIMLAIASIPIVGPIIVGVIALVDALIAGICTISKTAGLDLEEKASVEIPRSGGAKLSFCAGITGLATETVRFLIYSQTSLVGNMKEKDRLTTSNFALNLTHPELGFQVGNEFKPELRVDDKIKLPGQPFDWKSLVYFWQFNWDNLDNTTHRYDLTTEASDSDASRRTVESSEMESEWRELNPDGTLTDSHRSPGIHYDDPLVMKPAIAKLPEAQASVPFTVAGINVAAPLYLRESYANPTQECWTVPLPPVPPAVFLTAVPVCYIRGDTGANHIDLGLRYDIFPASLDEFYKPADVGKGVSLAWGQTGELTFPVMKDFDGDGLFGPAAGGNDADDRFWDADRDGLSDLFETQRGTNPRLADSDEDGLNDRVELLAGSNARQSDSDGDGLLDGEEVFHVDSQGAWSGGWVFVYDMVAGEAQRTWVTSNPVAWNGDGDTFTDFQERLYGLHPGVLSDPTVLKLKSKFTEAQAPVTLLRFEERAGATLFADASGLANNATCSGDACPVAGHAGKFTNGLIFDGQNDVLQTAEATPLGSGSFSLALWARRDAADRADLLFGAGDASSAEKLWLGFGADNRFACGFTADSILLSSASSDTGWHHWACTVELQPSLTDLGTVTATLYRDGEVADQRTFSRALGYMGSGDWRIGGAYDFSGVFSGFSGALDEFVATSVALNQNQILALMQARYNAGSSELLVAPGEQLAYDATLENNLLGRSLTGLLSVGAPPAWANAGKPATYHLTPAETQTLHGALAVDAATASGAYSVSVTAGAAATNPDAQQPPAPTAPEVYFSFDDASNRLLFAPGQWSTQRTGWLNTTPGVGPGEAVSLNGQSVFQTGSALFDVSGTPFTYAVWVKPDSGAGVRAVFGQPPDGRDWTYANSGVFLRVQDGKHLIFGWGDNWSLGPLQNAVTPGAWNHVAVTFDQNNTLTVFVNGAQAGAATAPSRPLARGSFALGDDNYCAEFELKNVKTKSEGDPGEASAEYVYRFVDETGNRDTLLSDDNADTGDWEPGSGPSKGEYFSDVKRTYCGNNARVYVYEDDGALGHDDDMSPDVWFNIDTPNLVGYPSANYHNYRSPDISGDGTVEFYYELHNPVLPFVGSIDDLRLYRRALSVEEVQQLYETASVPYHYTLDDAPGSGLDGRSWFNFANEGAVADPDALGTCESCPTSGLPGRVNRAVSFGRIDETGNPIDEGITIKSLTLPQRAPGFSLWANPAAPGVFFSLYGAANQWVASLTYDLLGHFCVANGAGAACSTTAYATGQWTHTMLSFADQELTLHLNNSEQVKLQTASPAWPGTGDYQVGLAGTSFRGLLDDLRIPYAGDDVAAMFATAPRVSLHLDEAGAGVTSFVDVGGANATCSGDACPAAGRRGKVAQAAAFDGIDDGLTIPDSAQLDLDNFTLAAWVQPTPLDATTGGRPLIAKSEGDFRNYALYLTAERKLYATRYCSGAPLIELSSQATLPIGQFTHVAATYDGKSLAIYINGVLDSSLQKASANSCQNDAPLTIGLPYSASAYPHFDGLLDEVLVYPDALWNYEIHDLYTAQANWIEEKESHAVKVDAEPPVSSLADTLPASVNNFALADVQVSVNATDAGSEVILLELGVSFNGGEVAWTAAEPCQDAAQGGAASPAWCAWFMPSQWGGAGRYQLQTRATDAVGHREAPAASYTIVVDGAAPELTLTQTDGALQNLTVHETIIAAQSLRLDGAISDPPVGADAGSGARAVWVTLRNAQGEVVGDAPYAASLTGATWSLHYPLRQSQIGGVYTVEVWAEDAVGNRTAPLLRTLVLDGAAPAMTLDETASALPTSAQTFQFLTASTVLQGSLSDALGDAQVAGVQSGAVAFTPLWTVERSSMSSPHRATALAGQTLYLPLDDIVHPISDTMTTYRNLATPNAVGAACSDIDCPAAGNNGPTGAAVDFDGRHDAINLPPGVLQSDDFTFAAWVYWRGGATQRLFDFSGLADERFELLTSFPVGTVQLSGRSGASNLSEWLSTSTKLPAYQWVHLAVTLEGDTARIFFDGVEQPLFTMSVNARLDTNQFTINPTAVVGDKPVLGSTVEGRNHFDGLMSDVRIFSRALNVWDIKALHLGNRALLSLPLDEALAVDGSLLADNSGWQWTATQHSGPGDAANKSVAGVQGERGLDFDGVDDYVSLPAQMGSRFVGSNADFSFASWVYWRGGAADANNFTAPQAIVSFGQGVAASTELQLNQGLSFNINAGGGDDPFAAAEQMRTNAPFPTNQWVHVAVTVEPDPGAGPATGLFGITGRSLARIYIDGVEQARQVFSQSPAALLGMNNNFLGRAQESALPTFNGRLDDVRVYPRSLSAAEVADLARASWRPVTLGENAVWQLNVPAGLEGVYRLDLLATDQGGHIAYNQTKPALNQTIDSQPPRATLTRQTLADGQVSYTFHAVDLHLAEAGLVTPCGAGGQLDKAYRADSHVQGHQQLTGLTAACTLPAPPADERATVCDAAGQCATVDPVTESAPVQGYVPTPGQSASQPLALASTSRGTTRLIRYTQPARLPEPASQSELATPTVKHPRRDQSVEIKRPVAQDGAAAALDLGLILHWPLEEGPDNCAVQDGSGNALSGALTNLDCTAAWSTDVPAGSGQNYSLAFAGGGYLSSAASELLPAENSPRTLCAWAKSTDGVVNGWAEHVVNYGAAAESQAFGFMLYTGNTWYAYSHAIDINSQLAADAAWHHHCVAHDGVTLTYYLDGQALASSLMTLRTPPNTPLLVGVRPDLVANTSFDGWVDDVRLYNRVLSAGEVQALYAPPTTTDPATAAPADATNTDVALPAVLLAAETFTMSAYSTAGGLLFNGEISDDSGVISATAALDLGGARHALVVHLTPEDAPAGYVGGNAFYTSTPWSAAWRPAAEAGRLDAVSGVLTLTLHRAATDAAATPATVQFPVTIDFQAPQVEPPTLLVDGAPLHAESTYSAPLLNTAVTIAPVTDAGGVTLWYGWSESITATVDALTQAADPAAGVQIDQPFALTPAEGRKVYYFHVIAADASGNTTRQLHGPFYHDLPGMPDQVSIAQLHGGGSSGPYRGWLANGCTLLGADQRLADAPQSLHLTWDSEFVHLVWEGADWQRDGDLFIYLDTISGQGSLGAHNPYTSTANSTVLLLPVREVPGAAELDAMQADYALWVSDSTRAHLLRWDGSAWIDDGELGDLGGAYAFSHDPDGLYSDLVLPFSLLGSPTERIDLVAFAVDAEEGASGGLRVWSVLPYANPVDSRRVVVGAPAPDQPHRLLLTDRYAVSLAAGTCFTPEANLAFSLRSDDGLAYDASDDRIRLLLADAKADSSPWRELLAPYDDAYQAWLAEVYCPAQPAFPGCHAESKPPAARTVAELLRVNGLAAAPHPPLLPNHAVTYTLHFVNPTPAQTTLPAYLYTNGDLSNPQAGVIFQNQNWVDGCPGWLALELPPGAGALTFTGVVQPGGANLVTLDIAPRYTRDGCAVSGDAAAPPAFRLTVEHTPDDGAPGYVALAPDFTASGPISATIRGVVRDASPVPLIELEVNGAGGVACEDATPADGQWSCDWDVVAANGGTAPDTGAQFTLRARATDSFGQQSDWSAPRVVVIDAQAPEIGSVRIATAGAQDGATPALVADAALRVTGVVTDSPAPAVVEVCDATTEQCAAAQLTLAPFSRPPSVYGYTDTPDTPLTLEDAAACAEGVGLVRTFAVADAFTIAGVEVGLRLAHPYRSDLSARLTAPSGAQVTLFAFDRNVLAANVNALFTDAGAALLADELADHSLPGAFATNTYRPVDRLAAFEGQAATGTWTLTLCDRDPANDAGVFEAAELHFTAVTPLLTVRSDWTYSEDAGSSDGVTYTRQIFAVDEHGHRTLAPVEFSVEVDNVAPVLAATQSQPGRLVNSSQPVLEGAVSDGGGVQELRVVVMDPLGRNTSEAVGVQDGAWTYTLTPALGGDYRLTVYAADRAGNQTAAGPFTVTALLPLAVSQVVAPEDAVEAGGLVTYTLHVENPNAAETAQAVRLRSSLSAWLTPVASEDATLTEGAFTWPAVNLEPGAALTKTVVARLPDTLLITNTITGALPITDWVNLTGAIIPSQAFVESDNLGASESSISAFVVEGGKTTTTPALFELALEAAPAPLVRDSVASYTLSLTNTTDQPAAQVVVSLRLSPALLPEELGSATYAAETNTIAWPAFDLLPGDMAAFAFTARLATDAQIEDAVFLTATTADATGASTQSEFAVFVQPTAEEESADEDNADAASTNEATQAPATATSTDRAAPVTSVAWMADGQALASGANDGSVLIWDAAGVEVVKQLGVPGVAIHSLAWTPEDAGLATGAEDGSITLWNVETGEAVLVLLGHSAAVNSVAWSPDWQLASGSDDQTVLIWDPESGERRLVLTGHTAAVTSVAWSPDGAVLLSATEDGAILVWDAQTGELLRTLAAHTAALYSVAWSPAGNRIAAGARDGAVLLWDVETGEPLPVQAIHTGAVNSVVWSPDGSVLLSGADDGAVLLWDATGVLLGRLGEPGAAVTSIALSPDSNLVAAGLAGNSVRILSEADVVQVER